jgi:outer membrane protein TolC
MITAKCWAIALVVAMLVLPGCATYERRPLELDQYAKKWAVREIDGPTVRAFADTLADDEEEAPYDPSDGLSLAEAEAVALVFNPELRLLRARAEVPLAGARESGWWPDPEFEAEVLRFANRGSRSKFKFDKGSLDGINPGVLAPGGLSADGLETSPPGYRRVDGDYIDDPWIIGAGLSITIPISGRLAVEQDWAWAEYNASWRQILIAEWELLTRLRAAWFAWSTTLEQIEVVNGYVEQLGGVATITERLASTGELNSTDARLLRVELLRQRSAVQSLESQAEQQRVELFAALGVDPDAPIQLVPGTFLPTMDVPEAERRALLLRRDPRVLAARAEYEAAEQRLRLEVRKQYPDLTVGPSYSFEEGFSRVGLGFGLPLPLWNHNRQAVAEAAAERDAAKVRAEAQVEQVLSELARATARLRFATERRVMLIDGLVPLVDRQVEETRKLLDLGEIDVLVLREALSAAVEAKLELLEASLAEAQAAGTLRQMLAPRWITPSQSENKEDSQ